MPQNGIKCIWYSIDFIIISHLNNQMGKKTKSKQRLDTYYHYAKQQGYRSRAAYKLIQLNRKYNFLNTSTVLIDLCAAPGGWMQVASECMPMNSTIVGVDLDPIKRVPGTKSFIGDITTQTCYDQLRKETHGQKCDVVLNDGAPNVGANWSKDAYSQSELVLAALKLACSFLRQGGYFITKVFRSTDFQSLMWVFKKFFERVEATKPKASRFSSAQIFVVCAGYRAPSFIDQKLFDAKFVFQDTEADHFHEQLAGEITSIDKLLEDRRKRGGYEDNAPMHLYKQISLSNFIQSETPLLVFAKYNKITVTPEEKTKYFTLVKNVPRDLDSLFEDLRVIGKRQIGSILKWRSKINHLFVQQKITKQKKEAETSKMQIQGQENQEDSEVQLEKEVLHSRRREIKHLKQKEDKRSELMIKSQVANKQHHESQDQFGENVEGVFEGDIEELQYQEEPEEVKPKDQKKKMASFSQKELQKNLEEIYEARKQVKNDREQQMREAREARKDRRNERFQTKERKLKCRKIGADPELIGKTQGYDENEQEQEEVEHEFKQITFKNPLADMDDDDLYISDNEEEINEEAVDPNEKIDGELSDDDAYVIPKPLSDMQKRRQQLKKNTLKKQKKLKKDIVEGEDVGDQIQIVKHKHMQDYNIDELAETLAIGKKMLRNRSRDDILDSSYSRFNFEDHDDLPKWFSEDEKKHNFKKTPITKQQFQQQKQRLIAINARVPKKILEAKVRRKMRIQKKLKKTQKQAEVVMNQDGVTEYNKLRQISKMYDKSKRELKDNKKYIVSSKSRTGAGKDSRNVKHVDSRMKKDKRSLKVKKTRQVKRTHKRRGKF